MEVQVVDDIYDKNAASKMGIDRKGQICVLIHSGSRGLGHQVATDALTLMEKAMARDKLELNDRQVSSIPTPIFLLIWRSWLVLELIHKKDKITLPLCQLLQIMLGLTGNIAQCVRDQY